MIVMGNLPLPSAKDAKTNARLVKLLLPGTQIVPSKLDFGGLACISPLSLFVDPGERVSQSDCIALIQL